MGFCIYKVNRIIHITFWGKTINTFIKIGFSIRSTAITTIYLHQQDISEANPFNVANLLPGLPYIKHLTSVGDGTGTYNLNGDYSAASQNFYFQPPATNKFYIHTVLVQISDNAKFVQDGYGAITGGLTNGISFWVNTGAGEVPLLSGHVFKQNYEFFHITSRVNLTDFSGTAETLAISINIVDDYGAPLVLDGSLNQQFIVKLHDNFTGLTGHHFALLGRIVTI